MSEGYILTWIRYIGYIIILTTLRTCNKVFTLLNSGHKVCMLQLILKKLWQPVQLFDIAKSSFQGFYLTYEK